MLPSLVHAAALLPLAQQAAEEETDVWGTVIKVGILTILYPIWWPVLKALYRDFNGALWEEGGLFGRDPTPRELDQLRERYEDYESPLVNVERGRGGRGAGEPQQRPSGGAGRGREGPGGGAQGPRRRTF